MNTPNARAIKTARTNADSIFNTYRATPNPIFPGAFTIADMTAEGHSYEVWTPGVLSTYPEGKCSCPFFAKEATCKHIYRAMDEQEWEAKTVAEYETRVAA